MLRSAVDTFLILIVIGALIGSVWAGCPEGDLDNNCRVDFDDVRFLAERWLEGPGSEANLTGKDEVDMADFSVVAMHWGQVGQRTGSVQVQITPNSAVNLGAKWRIDGGPWLDSGQRVNELAVGFHTIEFKPIDIWAEPADVEAFVDEDLITALKPAYKHPLEINEFMASNSGNALNSPAGNAKDEHGDYDDWIEVFNAGTETVDAAGMYLMDDDGNKWRFPGNNPLTAIASSGYLLIWADNWNDNEANNGPLHANFKLSAGGDKIFLYDTDGESLIDDVDFGDQTHDISYGRDANDSWRFFPYPSPGWENDDAYLGAVADTKFSHDRGFYDLPFSVTIATETKDATIKYTTNGSAPSETVGHEYTGAVLIDKTTCLRAMAFKTGFKPTDVDTHTYIFVDKVIEQPEMSTTITQNPIWGPQMRGALLEIPTISLVTPYTIPDDPIQSPPEVPVSIEMIFPDGTKGFQANAGVERFGGQYTVWPKQALRISFKSIYGPSRLDFDLFGDTPYGGDDTTDSFNQIILRNGSHDSLWYDGYTSKGTYVRNRYCFDRQLEMGHLSLRGRFVHVYLNGVYWGQYHLMERPTADFMATYLGGDEEDYDIMKGRSGIFVAEGDRAAWNYMVANTNNYKIVQEYMDIDNYIDYMLLNFYGGNDHDWYPHHNWLAGRKREAGNKFMFFMWDNDFLMRRLNGNTIDNGGPGNMLDSLVRHEDFKVRLADRAQKHFFNGGMLTPARVQADFTELTNRIARTIIPECARWSQEGSGGTYTPDSLQQYVDWIKFDHGNFRTDIVIQQMRNAGLFPDVGAPLLYVNGAHQHGGQISSSDLLSLRTSGIETYIDVELISEGAFVRAHVPLDNSLGLTWTSRTYTPDSSWTDGSTRTGVGYENDTGYQNWIGTDVKAQMLGISTSVFARVEFNLSQLESYDKLELQMRYDDGFIAYLNGQQIYRTLNITNDIPGLASAGSHEAGSEYEKFNITSFQNLLTVGTNVLAIHGINYSTTNPDMIIQPKLVGSVLDISSSTLPTWYTLDGPDPREFRRGAIEYTGPFKLTRSRNVKAKTFYNSTWSALTEAVYAVGPVVENLRITELMYHPLDTNEPEDPNEEYIELKNISTTTDLNLNLVKFTNGIDYTFSNETLGAGDYVILAKNPAVFNATYSVLPDVNVLGPYDGRLDNGGERVEVVDAIGRIIHNFRYRDGWRKITDGSDYSLTIIDPTNSDPNSWEQKDSWRPSAYAGGSPGQDDSGILPNPGAIVINEVLAHSHSVAADWIEFYNTTGDTIDIGGWFISDSNANLAKYEFATGTKIGPYKYLVLTENLHFGNKNAAGCHEPFALSENGEQVYLSSAENGVLTGYRNVEDFGASETGVSFGRYYKPSTDNYNFVPMEHNTQGSANADPQVGPIVISEIMYNPDWPDGGSYTNNQYEYVELRNITAEPVTLYRFDKALPWKFTEGIEFVFPAWPSAVTIPAGGHIVLVKDPNAFTWRYPGVPAAKVFGPYTGQLANDGEQVELSMPGDVDKYGERQYIRVDRVGYSDGSHPEDCPGGVDLWPIEADSGGKSLTRKVLADYGNDPANWMTSTPSPGE